MLWHLKYFSKLSNYAEFNIHTYECTYVYIHTHTHISVYVCVGGGLLSWNIWHVSIYSWCYDVSIINYLAVIFICSLHCFNLVGARNILMRYIRHPECGHLSLLWESTSMIVWELLEILQAFLSVGQQKSWLLPRRGFSASFSCEESRRTPAALNGIEMWGQKEFQSLTKGGVLL